MRVKDNQPREQPQGYPHFPGQQRPNEPRSEQPEHPGQPDNSKEPPGVSYDIEFEPLLSEPEPKLPAVQISFQDEDFGNTSIEAAEQRYKATEFQQEAAPLIRGAVEEEVKKAVEFNNENLKAEVNKAVKKDIGHRLDKYDKRRKWRFMADMTGTCIKWGIVALIALTIYGNVQLRTRICLVAGDVKEMVICLINHEEVSSNKLVEDLFRDLDDDSK